MSTAEHKNNAPDPPPGENGGIMANINNNIKLKPTAQVVARFFGWPAARGV
jgi:hypothetical protein